MSFLSEKFFRDNSVPGRLCLTGDKIVLNKALIPAGLDLIIRADTVELVESIILPSRLVHIFARHIKCGPNVTIDVSGERGDPDFANKSRADDGRASGLPGNQGQNGGDGKNAGQIKLTARSLEGSIRLIAKGGNGGQAQDGGYGAPGSKGGDGRDVGEGSPAGAHAGHGGKGGRAGNAGTPGKGGDGGSILVNIYAGISSGQIAPDVSPGAPGNKGTQGQPGAGGQPGNPGRYRVCEPVPD